MKFDIKKFTHKGLKFISVNKYVGDVWKERSFEYKDTDSIDSIIERINDSLIKLLND